MQNDSINSHLIKARQTKATQSIFNKNESVDLPEQIGAASKS